MCQCVTVLIASCDVGSQVQWKLVKLQSRCYLSLKSYTPLHIDPELLLSLIHLTCSLFSYTFKIWLTLYNQGNIKLTYHKSFIIKKIKIHKLVPADQSTNKKGFNFIDPSNIKLQSKYIVVFGLWWEPVNQKEPI